MRKVHILYAIWGERFWFLFLNCHIPSLLSDEGIEALIAQGLEVTLRIAMRREDENKLQEPALRALADCGITLTPVWVHPERYPAHQAFSECYKTVFFGIRPGDIGIPLMPDTLLSSGTLPRIVGLLENREAVFLHTVRAVAEEAVPEILSSLKEKKGHPSLTFSGRELVRLALKHLHPVCGSEFWDDGTYGYCSFKMAWRFAPHSYMAASFHSSPIAFRFSNYIADFSSTYDHDLVFETLRDPECFVVIPSSDEAMLVELSPRSKDAYPFRLDHGNVYPAANSANLAHWALSQTNPLHRRLGRTLVEIRGDASYSETELKLRAEATDKIEAYVADSLAILESNPASDFFTGRQDLAGKKLLRLLQSWEKNKKLLSQEHAADYLLLSWACLDNSSLREVLHSLSYGIDEDLALLLCLNRPQLISFVSALPHRLPWGRRTRRILVWYRSLLPGPSKLPVRAWAARRLKRRVHERKEKLLGFFDHFYAVHFHGQKRATI